MNHRIAFPRALCTPGASRARIASALLALALALSAFAALIPTHSHAIEATTDFDAYDLLFSEQIGVLDRYFELDVAFMQYTVSGILYPWEEAEQSGWMPKRVNEADFEQVLGQYFAPTPYQLASLRDACGYDAESKSYQVMPFDGPGARIPSRQYMGYVRLHPETSESSSAPDPVPTPAPVTAPPSVASPISSEDPQKESSAVSDPLAEAPIAGPLESLEQSLAPAVTEPILYDVFFRTIRYRALSATDGDAMNALEAAGWPATWEHEGILYRLTTEGYVAKIGYANEGICYTVEILDGHVRYHASRPFTASDLPEAFDHVNQVSLTLPAGMTLSGVHEAFPDKSVVAVTRVGAKAVLDRVAGAFPSVVGDWQIYNILAPALPENALTVTLSYQGPLSEDGVFAFCTDETGAYLPISVTLTLDPASGQTRISAELPPLCRPTFGFCIDAVASTALPPPPPPPQSGMSSEEPDPIPDSDTASTERPPVTHPLATLIPATASPETDPPPAVSGPLDPAPAVSDWDDTEMTDTETTKKKGCKSAISPYGILTLGITCGMAWLLFENREKKR